MLNRVADSPAQQERDADRYRYERKFVTPDLSREEVDVLVKLHPAMFSKIYHDRYVNNIYFDSWCLSSFKDNVEGISERLKCRVRWYGELFGTIARPVLELKSKLSLLGKKDSFPLRPFSLDQGFDGRNFFEKEDLPELLKAHLATLQPTLLNRYLRRYYLSADRKFRLTLDSDLAYYRISASHNTFLQQTLDKRLLIVELKFHRDDDRGAERISNQFPFRLSKSSKYVSGIWELNAW
jgi:SPX domain protein involved in polyphosphate accumulation